MKKLALLACASLLILGSTAAQAQSAKATANPNAVSASRAAVIIAPGALGGPIGSTAATAAAATASNTLNQPQMVMNTGSAPSTGTFNDCGIAFSGGLWLLTLSYTGESKSCVAQRQALLAMQMGTADMAFELMCDVDTWKGAAERTAAKGRPTAECRSTQVSREAAEAKRPQTVAIIAPNQNPQVALADVPPAERCYGADGSISGRVVNGACR